MNLAALIFTVITAGSALWTVALAYKAIKVAKESAESGKEAATAGKDAADAAKETAEEVRLGRQRDRLESERRRLHDLLALVEELGTTQQVAVSERDYRWAMPRNMLVAKLAGRENDFPGTQVLTQNSPPSAAPISTARAELRDALQSVEKDIYIHDLQ